jgi:putative PEP-CTERM system TPR-repeat lipoprotein
LALSTPISPQANSSNSASLGQNLARLSNNKPTDLASLTSNSGALDETTATPSYSSQAGAEVVAALVAGEVDKAAIALARMRVEEGSSESVGLLNAALMAMRQEYNGARKQFEALIVANPDSLRPRIGLAQLLMQTGETSQAEQVLGEILAKDPSNETSLTSVLPVLLSTGRTERAVRLLENAAKAAPDNKKIGITLASLYLQAGMADKALVQIDLVIGKAEATSVQLRLRGLTLVTLRRLPEAIEAYSQLQRKSPGDVTVVRELLGLHLNAKNYLAARDVVQVALRTQPNNIELLRLLIATDLAEGGEAAALASLDKMRAVPTTELAARELRADFDMFRHRFLDAAEAYSQTYKIAPTSVLALKSAQAFMQAGQVIAASDMLKTWLATTPNDTNALRMLSDINMSANQFDAAGELLERLVAQQPDDILALNNLAYIYSLQKSPKAVPMARRAYIMRPSPETAETLGWSLVQAGDAPAGLPLIAQAAVALPADPSVQYHYAVSLKQVGKTREALEVAQKLGDQNTGFADQDKLRVLVQELRNAP